jgi:hypothetical protein
MIAVKLWEGGSALSVTLAEVVEVSIEQSHRPKSIGICSMTANIRHLNRCLVFKN